MASVNYMKAKTPQDVKRVMRHCDKEMRKEDTHANKNINVNVTDNNLQFGGSYEEVCEKYDKRIEYLDSLEGANKRKDRVSCFFLEVPLPEGLMSSNFTRKDRIHWCNKVNATVREQYGAENVICGYIHFDEQHEYKDAETKKKRSSRIHMHLGCIPEHDGKLNGKWFSSRANMIALNTAIHEMTEKEFGVKFMDGSKKKSGKAVEQLKLESSIVELREQCSELTSQRDTLKGEIRHLQAEKQQKAEENAKMAQIASERVREASKLLQDAAEQDELIRKLRNECLQLRKELSEQVDAKEAALDAKRRELARKRAAMQDTIDKYAFLERGTQNANQNSHDEYQ